MSLQNIPILGPIVSGIVHTVQSVISSNTPLETLANTVCTTTNLMLRDPKLSQNTKDKLLKLTATCQAFNDPNNPKDDATYIGFLKTFIQTIAPVQSLSEGDLDSTTRNMVNALATMVAAYLEGFKRQGNPAAISSSSSTTSMAAKSRKRGRKTSSKKKKSKKPTATRRSKRHRARY